MNTLLTTSEVAEILNVCYQTIRKLMNHPIEPIFYLRIGLHMIRKKRCISYKTKINKIICTF